MYPNHGHLAGGLFHLTGGSWKRDTTGQGHHSGTTLRETAGTQGCGAYSRLDVHAPAPDPTVWLYPRFPLSLRDLEQMMAQRGVTVSYDTIHQWSRTFGQLYANGRHRPSILVLNPLRIAGPAQACSAGSGRGRVLA
jgi:hypothetical protein